MKIALRIIIIFLFINFFQLNAVAAEPLKIGIVDMQKFQRNSKAVKKTMAELKKKFDAMQLRLNQEKEALLKLEEGFRKQSMMLSLDAKEDKKRELAKKRRYYKYLYDEFTQDMKSLELKTTREIGKDLEKALKKIGLDEQYSIILEKRTIGLIYYNDAIDVTNIIVEAYDKEKQ